MMPWRSQVAGFLICTTWKRENCGWSNVATRIQRRHRLCIWQVTGVAPRVVVTCQSTSVTVTRSGIFVSAKNRSHTSISSIHVTSIWSNCKQCFVLALWKWKECQTMGYGEESRFHRKNGFDQANISVAAPILLARGVKSGWNTWTSRHLIGKERTSSCRPAFERQVLILKISISSRYHVFCPMDP